MAFIRCTKHPDIVMHRELDGERSDFSVPVYLPGLRCRVCQEIRPLEKKIRELQALKEATHYEDPGVGWCENCTVYRAEGKIELMSHITLHLCRSCVGLVRTRLKALVKQMDKRAKELNKGRSRP